MGRIKRVSYMDEILRELIAALPTSPTVLDKSNIGKIHRYIPVPTDYKILWADIGSFGGYPAGVVITDRAMIAKASREETKNIVREGKLTYNQALNLAKAGTIESITFDAYTGAVNCLSVFVCLLLPLLHRLIG